MAISTYSELLNFKEKLVSWIEGKVEDENIQQSNYVVFLSYGNIQKRCQVWENCDLQLSKVIKRLLNFIDKIYKKDNKLLELVKIDIAYNVEKKIFQDVVHELNNQKHNNHMRKGISLKENFEISFLEQEIYGKSIIKGVVYNEPNFFDEQNLNDAINKKYP